jgi:CheY-like chemotaxis protein
MARILVIDDQEHIRFVIKSLLTMDNHEIEVAENGRIGLQQVRTGQFDLVITDVVMPELDGFEVITGIKELTPAAGLIVMSGGGVKLDIENLLVMATYLGADRVVSKPLDFTRLQVAVREVLASRKTVSGCDTGAFV